MTGIFRIITMSSAYSVDSILLASWEANISKVPANTFGGICCYLRYLKMNSRKKTGDIPACYVSLLEGKEKLPSAPPTKQTQ